MTLLKMFGQGLYAGIWTYALTDTLHPAYTYYAYSAVYGFIPTHVKTDYKDVQLFNLLAFEVALVALFSVLLALLAKDVATARYMRKSRAMLQDLISATSFSNPRNGDNNPCITHDNKKSC